MSLEQAILANNKMLQMINAILKQKVINDKYSP